LCKHKTAWDAHDFVRALFDEVFIFDIYRNKELSRSVLTLAVSVYMQQGPKIVVVNWAFKKIVFKIRQCKSRRRTTIMMDEFDRKNFCV